MRTRAIMLLKVTHVVIMDTEFAIRLELEDSELDIGLTLDAAAQRDCRLDPAPRSEASCVARRPTCMLQ